MFQKKKNALLIFTESFMLNTQISVLLEDQTTISQTANHKKFLIHIFHRMVTLFLFSLFHTIEEMRFMMTGPRNKFFMFYHKCKIINKMYFQIGHLFIFAFIKQRLYYYHKTYSSRHCLRKIISTCHIAACMSSSSLYRDIVVCIQLLLSNDLFQNIFFIR